MERLFKYLDRPFFVTVIGGLILAMAGYIYQTLEKKKELDVANSKAIQQTKMQLLGEFADLSYARTQAFVDRNTAIIFQISNQHSLNEAESNRIILDIDAAKKRITDLKSVSSVLYRIRPLLSDSGTLLSFTEYIRASERFDSASDSLLTGYLGISA